MKLWDDSSSQRLWVDVIICNGSKHLTISILETIRSGKTLDALSSKEPTFFPDEGTRVFFEVEEKSFWFEHRRQVVSNALQRFISRQAVGLDLGCGSGYTVVWLNQQGWDVYGVDALPGVRKDFLERYPQRFATLQMTEMSYVAEFDFVLLLDVLEHLPDPEQLLKKINSLLKPGGVVIVTVPAFRWLWSQADQDLKHLRRYTISELKMMITRSDGAWKITQADYLFWSIFPFYLLSRLFVDFKKQNQPLGLLNGFFKGLLAIERKFRDLGVKLPIGSSAFVVIQKSK